MYLVAVIDLCSRYLVNWGLSNTMEAGWIVAVVKEAIEQYGPPKILNGDQGSHFTSEEYINLLKSYNIQIDMDGKGRATDNIFIEVRFVYSGTAFENAGRSRAAPAA